MDPTDKKDVKPARKPYSTPVLEVYGDVRRITNFINGGMGMNDMTSGPEKTGT